MTDYLREARNAYNRAENMTDAEVTQSAALIAIAEALQPTKTEIKIEGQIYDPASIRDGVQAVLDHDPRHQQAQAIRQARLDALREAHKAWGKILRCPTCDDGRSRETVNMVCQTCGTDYGADR